MQEGLFYSLLALVAGFLIWLPRISNHGEAEDAYMYAWAAENSTHAQLLHPHHRLYHPLTKVVWEWSGQERAFGVLSVMSGVASSVAVFLFVLVLRRAGVWSLTMQACVTLGMVVTYGFWRYAREVEVYPLGWVVVLAAVLFLLREPPGGWSYWVILALGLLVAGLIHISLLIPLGAMAACRVFLSRSWMPGMVCGISAIVLFFAADRGLGSIYETEGFDMGKETWRTLDLEDIDSGVAVRPRPGWSPKSMLKATAGVGACLYGVMPLMSFDFIFDWLSNRLFPYRDLQEERLLVYDLPSWRQWGWMVSLVGSLALLGGLLFLSGAGARLMKPESLLVLSGLVAFGGLILVFEPGNPEMWLTGIPLFWLVLGFLLVRAKLLAMFVPLFALTNWLGGMGLLHDPNRSYDQVTGKPLLGHHLGADDLVLVDVSAEAHQRFLSYQTELRVLMLSGRTADHTRVQKVVEETLAAGGRVFLHPSMPRPRWLAQFEQKLDDESGVIELDRPRGSSLSW